MFEPQVEPIRLEFVSDDGQVWAGADEPRGAALFSGSLDPQVCQTTRHGSVAAGQS